MIDDLTQAQNSASLQGLAITMINGEDATSWLTRFAARNSFGLLDPNTDWNGLMSSPAADIQGYPGTFTGQSPFYPGNTLNFTQENGEVISTQWRSLANVPFDAPPISNGPDVYQYFVLYKIPADDTSSTSTPTETPTDTPINTPTDTATDAPIDTPSPTTSSESSSDIPNPTITSDSQSNTMPTSWSVPAYPSNPVVVQANLGTGGYVTGYFLYDSLTAVLSIPSFEMTGPAIADFSNKIGEFLSSSKEAGMTKVVIDLQQNLGGEILLAVDTFRQFFPSIDPYGGSRLRSFKYSNVLGNTYTQYYQRYLAAQNGQNVSVTDELLDIPWAVLDYLNADTNQNFTSWSEFFGPHPDHGDFFSTVQRDNLSSILFDEVASGGYYDGTPAGIVIYGYGNRSTTAPPPFIPEDIVLLTDGNCQSSCAVFLEMMHNEAGVRTVTVGGRPSTGPVQAVSGTRGALSYNAFDLDNDIYAVVSVNATANNYLPRSHISGDLQFWITSAQFNLRDQIRKGQDVPLQFIYEAADCRIYWTLATFNNFTALWEHAASAIWQNTILCVKDSTIFPSTANGTIDTKGPSDDQKASWAGNIPGLPKTTTYVPTLITPVQQISDGQIQVQTTPTGLVTEFPDGQPQVSATSVPSPSNLGQAIDNGGLPTDNRVAVDDGLPQRTLTLNQICGANLPSCSIKLGEKCIVAPSCTNGQWDNEKRCKRACTSTTECTGTRRPQICNVDDTVCSFDASTKRYRCRRITMPKAIRGSGYVRVTTGIQVVPSGNYNFLAGYCENKIPASGTCKNYEGNRIPPPASIKSIDLNQATPIPTLIFDTPTSPGRGNQESSPDPQLAPPSGQQAAVQAGSAGKSVGDYIAGMWGS